jgi:hypothetical protein
MAGLEMAILVHETSRKFHGLTRDARLPLRICSLARKRWKVWALMASTLIIGRIVLLPLLPIPEPVYADEFCYLLAGDTFAHGRLANPSPAYPEFFESPHLLMRPTYASKYPPGQGVILFLGELLAGHPYWGVVASGALMILLFCWMADAWLPPQWALAAGGVSAVIFFIPHYWFTSYWGGNLAACGGALVAGALGNVLRGRFAAARLAFAAGAIVLYSTRPYEGGVLCVAVVIAAAHCFHRMPELRRRAMLRTVLLPNAALLALVVPFLLYQNFRVTGRATLLPAMLHASQYDMAPKFRFLPPGPARQYSNATLRQTHQWELGLYREAVTPGLAKRAMDLFMAFFAAVWMQFSVLGLLLVALPWAGLSRRKYYLLGLAAAGAAALLLEIVVLPHYTAPYTPILLLLIAICARALWYRVLALRFGSLLLALMLCVILLFVVHDYTVALQNPGATQRSRIVQQLIGKGGRHLVFVDYVEGWSFHDEWVYNGAELGQEPVLLAHFRGDKENRELMNAFQSRSVWLLTLGPKPTDIRLESYSAAVKHD